jgi:hypothetical protein
VSVRQVLIRDRNSQDIVGVGILGRPVSRILDDGLTLEVSRTATDGTPHACSAETLFYAHEKLTGNLPMGGKWVLVG